MPDYETDEFAWESDPESDYGERRRRRFVPPRRPLFRPPSQPSVSPRTVERLDERHTRRENTLLNRVEREEERRRRDITSVRRNQQQYQQLAFLLPLLLPTRLQPRVVEVSTPGSPPGTARVLAEGTDVRPPDLTFLILLMFLMPGMGFSGGTTGQGDSSSMLPLLLVLLLTQQQRSSNP